MSDEPFTVALRSSSAVSERSASAADDGRLAPVAAMVHQRLGNGGTTPVTRMPARLDVMGGIAEYTGGLLLSMPAADFVCAAVEPRQDGAVCVHVLDRPGADTWHELRVDGGALIADGRARDAAACRQALGAGAPLMARASVAALVESARDRAGADWARGMTIVLDSTMERSDEYSRAAAAAAATLRCLATHARTPLDPAEALRVCRRVEADWLGVCQGGGDVLSGLLAEPGCVTQICSQTATRVDSAPLPDDLCAVGVDCGVVDDDAVAAYAAVRTATLMGREIIGRIVTHEDGADAWRGYLADVPVDDYVSRFRDRIPTKLKGSEYLDRFGQLDDPIGRVEPKTVYKVRSRTEHHVYEHDRSVKFGAALRRYAETREDAALREIRELMNASHWSYGQRCGLGSIATDQLAALIRKHGHDAGVVGARISGRGCGGVVFVLMRNDDAAMASLQSAIAQYEAQTGHTPTLIHAAGA